MTAEQIAVNASAAAEIAGLDPKGYIVARCHEILHNIDTPDVDRDAQFAALEATSQAVRMVWEQEDADEPAEEDIAVAAAEAITGDVDLQEVDHTELPETGLIDPLMSFDLARAKEYVGNETPVQKAARNLFGKMGAWTNRT